MSSSTEHGPIWAIVMIVTALIAAYAAMHGSGKQEGSEPFQVPGGAKDLDCWQICGSANAVCLGAKRQDGQSVTCDFKGVKSSQSKTGFEFRDKTCTCQLR